MLKQIMAVCLVALSGAALADGVPIIVPAPALKANDPALRLPRPQGFVKLHPIIFAGGSFGANVLTVTIDGREYRFVGSVLPQKPPPKAAVSRQSSASSPAATQQAEPQSISWAGKEPGGGKLGITKFDNGDIHASVELPPGRLLVLSRPGGSSVLVEIDRAAAYAAPVLVPPDSAASGVQK